MVGGLLRELRAIRDGARVDDLFGTIAIGPTGAGYEDLAETRPLPDVSVRIIWGAGTVFSARTDEHGAYAFSSLPRGTYRIEPDLPAGLSTRESKAGKPLAIDIDDKDGTGAGCQIDIFSRPDGQISGTVLDATGKGVAGFITIQPADPKEAQIARRRGGLPGCETEDGNFSLPQLPQAATGSSFIPKSEKELTFDGCIIGRLVAGARTMPLNLRLANTSRRFALKFLNRPSEASSAHVSTTFLDMPFDVVAALREAAPPPSS